MKLIRVAALTAALSSAFALCANATVTGSMTVTNGTSATAPVPGTIQFTGCNLSANTTCNGFVNIAPGSSHTATVVNSHDVPSTQYGNTRVYISYVPQAGHDNPGVIQTPGCVWQVSIESNNLAIWSGSVATYATIDAGYNSGAGYTPTCSYSNFSVNSATGNWTLTIDWSHRLSRQI